MATFYKRRLAKGVRWTVRVRLKGREATDTFPTRAAAAKWARAQERAIETGEFVAIEPGKGPIFA
ncbi:MAG TPA: site-specific integrase, partial [Casimicrobiaceae bacterium]